MIETVGAGQSEVDIAKLAHTTLVVEAPGLGDDIQAIKAGILEIADIMVVNKADRPGAESTEKALKSMLELAHPTQRVFAHHGKYIERRPYRLKQRPICWIPSIQRTIATDGKGIDELAHQIAKHREHLHCQRRLDHSSARPPRVRAGCGSSICIDGFNSANAFRKINSIKSWIRFLKEACRRWKL